MRPTYDQDLTKPLVKCYLKSGKSKVGQANYCLTTLGKEFQVNVMSVP